MYTHTFKRTPHKKHLYCVYVTGPMEREKEREKHIIKASLNKAVPSVVEKLVSCMSRVGRAGDKGTHTHTHTHTYIHTYTYIQTDACSQLYFGVKIFLL